MLDVPIFTGVPYATCTNRPSPTTDVFANIYPTDGDAADIFKFAYSPVWPLVKDRSIELVFVVVASPVLVPELDPEKLLAAIVPENRPLPELFTENNFDPLKFSTSNIS